MRITEQYFAKELTLDQTRQLAHSDATDPLKPFGEACRAELRSLRAVGVASRTRANCLHISMTETITAFRTGDPSMRIAFLVLLVWVCSTPLAACAETPPFEMSDDGLYRRESDVFEQLWVRKQFDVRSYQKVMFATSIIHYQPQTSVAESDAPGPKSAPVTTRQKETLQDMVDAAFREELAKSRSFTLTNAPGPGVLMVRGALLHVVSYVPENASGKDDPLTVPNVGACNSGARTARLEHESDHGPREGSCRSEARRRHADGRSGGSRHVQAWANLLRERLDAAASIPPDKQ